MGSTGFAQTAKSLDTLYAEIESELASGQQKPISVFRLVLKNVVASAVNTSESYSNPAWLNSLAWTKVTGVPTSLSLLGISNGAALDTIAANGSAYYLSRSNHTGTQLAATISDFAAAALAAVTWSTLTGKPTFATVATSGAYNDLTGKPTLFDGAYASLTGKPTLGTAAALNVAASGDAASGEVVKGSDTRLSNARTPTTHTHAIADTTGLQAALDGKLGSGAQAADVNPAGTSIAAALAGKAASSHTHTASQISDSTAVGRSVMTATDQAAARTAIGAGTSSFSGAYSALSGIPSTFAPSAHASSHAAAGADPIVIAQSQVTNLTTDLAAKVPATRSVSTTHSLTGGGDLSADRTLSLVNDTASPGSNKVYGTDGSGVRGWKDDPAGSGAGRDLFNFGVIEIYEDFFIGAGTGTGWSSGAIGTGASSTSSEHDHEIRTGTTDNAGRWVQLSPGATSSVFLMDGTAAFDLRWLVKTRSSVANWRFRCGMNQTGRVIEPNDYIGFRFDKDNADTTWRAVARASSVDTLGADNLGAPSTNANHLLRMWSTGDGVIRFTVNNGTEATINSGLPSVRGHLFFVLATNDAVDMRVAIDAVAFRYTEARP